jgi:hypothetical protein
MNPNFINRRGKSTQPLQRSIIQIQNQVIIEELADRDFAVRKWLTSAHSSYHPVVLHEHYHNRRPTIANGAPLPPSAVYSSIVAPAIHADPQGEEGLPRSLEREWVQFKWKLEDDNIHSQEIRNISNKTLINGIKYLDQKYNLLQVMDSNAAQHILDYFALGGDTQLMPSRTGGHLQAQHDWAKSRGMELKSRGELEAEFWRLLNDVKCLSERR